jgi:predicted dehydrogenase
MTRRAFIASSAFAAAAPAAYRAVIIGHTGAGNYGHDWDTSFAGFSNIEVLAVADPVEAGRLKAQARSKAARAYSGYREMIAREKPNLVAICPRSLGERLEMFTAAANAGAHIVMEKPFAKDLRDADTMVALAEKNRIKVQVGHTARPTPFTLRVKKLLDEGHIGTLMEMRARGKEDKRAGGEDMMVLGTHLFDLMRFFAGDPVWATGHVTQKGRDITKADARQATEPLGPIAGDEIAATYYFKNNVHGYFASRPSDATTGDRFGITLYGSKGSIFVPTTSVPGGPPNVLLSRSWAAGEWKQVPRAQEDPSDHRGTANTMMVADLLDAIASNREPVCNHRDGRWTIEMTLAAYESHLRGGARVEFPLANRRHPLQG